MKPDLYETDDIPVEGYYDSGNYYWLIRKREECTERKEIDFLDIGGPGVDGISFGKRKGMKGIWAYYPISDEFEYKADSVKDLIKMWNSGQLNV